MNNVIFVFFVGALILDSAISYSLKVNEATNSRQKIVKGSIVNPGDAPYHVYLKYNREYHCGGALITLQHVVTAAHCLVLKSRNPNARLTVAAGSILRDYNGFEVEVKYFTIHPKYSAISKTFDIGVITLVVPFETSYHIRPIALTKQPVFDNEIVIMTGFGASGLDQDVSDYLKKITVPIYTYKECSRWLPSQVTISDVCILYNVGTSCLGDSGSPVVNSKGQLVAIVSRGFDCGSGTPSILTNIHYHLNFIYNSMY